MLQVWLMNIVMACWRYMRCDNCQMLVLAATAHATPQLHSTTYFRNVSLHELISLTISRFIMLGCCWCDLFVK
ncbi:unnamed protein product [Heligmosomoides polygyrus]|uniref:Uncharacterized protein n=1 Tax=Heligmosomoides polygyrus TaxID=6339 RepID=A0A3P8F6J2_HELPZ|nr:unnamed protein product [Heligmosomoides polygyrus]